MTLKSLFTATILFLLIVSMSICLIPFYEFSEATMTVVFSITVVLGGFLVGLILSDIED